jgi:hypothetical protein
LKTAVRFFSFPFFTSVAAWGPHSASIVLCVCIVGRRARHMRTLLSVLPVHAAYPVYHDAALSLSIMPVVAITLSGRTKPYWTTNASVLPVHGHPRLYYYTNL